MSPEPTFDVTCMGCVCWDFVAVVSRYPGPDEKAELSQLLQQGGGPAGTAAVTVARLGGHAAMWGTAGDDDFGRKCIQEFQQERVDVTHVVVEPGRTTRFAFCVAEEGTGHRAIFGKRGTAGELAPEALDRDALLDCRCLLVDGHQLAASVAAAGWAGERGIPIVLDLGHYQPEHEPLLEACSHPILARTWAQAWAGTDDLKEAGRRLQQRLARTVVVTLGAEGALAFTDEGVHHQPAFRVTPVVDTTGAGDVYHGAFAFGLARGWGLQENMRFAAAVAALKCRALGGRTGIPDLATARRFMGEQL